MIPNMPYAEWAELRRLVKVGRFRRLGLGEEQRLRHLLSKHDADATWMPWDDLIELGVLAVGVGVLGYMVARPATA